MLIQAIPFHNVETDVFRFHLMTAKSQSMEDLKEQMELKRLYANCDQVSVFVLFFHDKCLDNMCNKNNQNFVSVSSNKMCANQYSALLFVTGSGLCISAGQAVSCVYRGSPGGPTSPSPNPA